jgi:hypothetical protein
VHVGLGVPDHATLHLKGEHACYAREATLGGGVVLQKVTIGSMDDCLGTEGVNLASFGKVVILTDG